MGCKCGSQIILCNLPVRFDTYRGCSHGCRYCFAQKKNDISHIERDESVDGLRSFIEGKRGNETEWCDWNIPIHWGGMSDPFQPVEKQIRASYECLKLLAETKYPFVVSTKGRLIADPEYLDLLAQCNCVLQISMVCSKYDRLERGTPSYEERLTILKTVSARVQRTIVRIQPYMPEVFHDVMKFLSTPSARRATAKTETKSLFSNKLYNILHEFRRALIYNGSKNYPNHAKRLENPVRRCRKDAENSPFAPGRKTQNNSRPSCSKGG